MDTEPNPKFLHLHDVGLLLHDSGRRLPARRTLILRGRAFAEASGLRIYKVRNQEFVSTAELERVHQGEAA